MRFHTYFWTALCSSITFIVSLKLLEFFSFVKFSPTGWTKKWHVFADSHTLVKWFVLWVAVLVLAFILFAIAEKIKGIRMDLLSIVVAIIIVWYIEYSVQHTIYIRKFSIPLAVVIALHAIWITVTASYLASIRSLEAPQNQLPDSSNVLK